jgi:recombination protein RecT
MSSELAIFERQLDPLLPHFEQVLAGVMPAQRLARTLMISAERTPKLLICDRQSLLNAAMTCACLGLEVDGVTGQAFILPFKRKGVLHAQTIIGYKGYNSMGARGRITIDGEVVREGDRFNYRLGTGGFVHHTPALDNQGRIVAAWAKAEPADRPASVVVIGRGDIDAIMNRSPAMRYPDTDTPWRDPVIGFPAMSAKSAKRRLARSLPLTVFQYAARMEEAFEERGKLSWISPDRGVMIEGVAQPLTATEPSPTPTADQLLLQGSPPPPPDGLAAEGPPAPANGSQPPAGAGGVSPEEIAARLKAEVDALGTKRAHENWARNNKDAFHSLPMKLQHDVINYYEAHKSRATE